MGDPHLRPRHPRHPNPLKHSRQPTPPGRSFISLTRPRHPSAAVSVQAVYPGEVARWVGRAIGLDVHRDFCVVAVCEDGKVRSVGRVPSTPEDLGMLADSLLPTDRVALEVTGSCWEVARILDRM